LFLFLVNVFQAIFHRHLVDLKFPKWLYKQIIGQQVELDDLMETDPVFCKSLQWLLDNELGLDDPVVDFDFTVTKEGFGTQETIDLIPDGSSVPVNDNNKDLYVSLQLQWRINGSIKQQIDSIKEGNAKTLLHNQCLLLLLFTSDSNFFLCFLFLY
jgi:hypothetical protein